MCATQVSSLPFNEQNRQQHIRGTCMCAFVCFIRAGSINNLVGSIILKNKFIYVELKFSFLDSYLIDPIRFVGKDNIVGSMDQCVNFVLKK